MLWLVRIDRFLAFRLMRLGRRLLVGFRFGRRREGGLGIVLFRQVPDFYLLRLRGWRIRLDRLRGLPRLGRRWIGLPAPGLRPALAASDQASRSPASGYRALGQVEPRSSRGPGATSCGGAGGATASGARSIITAGGGASGVGSTSRQLRAAQAAVKWIAATTSAAVPQRSARQPPAFA